MGEDINTLDLQEDALAPVAIAYNLSGDIGGYSIDNSFVTLAKEDSPEFRARLELLAAAKDQYDTSFANLNIGKDAVKIHAEYLGLKTSAANELATAEESARNILAQAQLMAQEMADKAIARINEAEAIFMKAETDVRDLLLSAQKNADDILSTAQINANEILSNAALSQVQSDALAKENKELQKEYTSLINNINKEREDLARAISLNASEYEKWQSLISRIKTIISDT